MKKVKYAIIGFGNMGISHAQRMMTGKIENSELTAICDLDENVLKKAGKMYPSLKLFGNYKDLLSAKVCDAILICTYHYSHPEIAINAFENGYHVLTEKPAGVYTAAVEEMNEAAKNSGRIFGIMYNQRTNPVYKKVRDLVKCGELGEIKRATWVLTNWYRPQAYHNSSMWRSTWKGEGGGTLINQCPHNLDLWQWILGMPKSIRADIGFGKHYDIETDDEVIAIMEYENGAVGTFITSTAEAPGTNRFEIAGSRGKIEVTEKELKFFRLRTDEREFNKINTEGFGRPECWECTVPVDSNYPQHNGIIKNFSDAVLNGTALIAPGEEGINGLTLSNAMYLSAWTDSKITLPIDKVLFKKMLDEKIAASTYVKKVNSAGMDIERSGK